MTSGHRWTGVKPTCHRSALVRGRSVGVSARSAKGQRSNEGIVDLEVIFGFGGCFFVLIFGGFDIGFGRRGVLVALCSGFC
jgi:hypothetical protein